MLSLQGLLREEEITQRPVSLRSLLSDHKSTIPSLSALFASHEIIKKYIQLGAGVGRLGELKLGVLRTEHGSYRMDTELGFLDKNLDGPVEAMGEYDAAVDLAAVHCIGTEDPGNLGPNEDEVYGFISLFALLPATQQQVLTKKVGTQKNVGEGNIIFKNTPIGVINHFSGINGFKIHVSLWDEEPAGPPDDAPENISHAIEQGLAGVAGASTAITVIAPNPVTPAIAATAAAVATAMQNEWIRDGVKFLTTWLADALADDRIGEKEFTVTPTQIKKWSTQEGFDVSLKQDPVLGPDVFFNFPEDPNNPIWVFNEGGATYKVFFKIRSRKVDAFPIN